MLMARCCGREQRGTVGAHWAVLTRRDGQPGRPGETGAPLVSPPLRHPRAGNAPLSLILTSEERA